MRHMRNLGAAAIAIATVFVTAGCGATVTGIPEAAPADIVDVQVQDQGVIRAGVRDPKTTLDIFEDPRCPACASFEERDGDDIQAAVNGGTIAVRYHLLDFLNRQSDTQYSTRAIAAALCVAADQRSKTYFAFHTALFARWNQPAQVTADDPSDESLAELAKTAGASRNAVSCITNKSQLANATIAGKAALKELSAANLAGTPAVVNAGQVVNTASPRWLDPLR